MSNETVSGLSDGDVDDAVGGFETGGVGVEVVVVSARVHTHMQRIRIQRSCSIFGRVIVSGLTTILDALITHSV